MSRDQALRKILACLRLAGSSNPTEAATALRQARALMDKYGLTEADATAAEIRDVEAVTGFRGGMVPRSMLALAGMVADGYRCTLVVDRGFKTVIRFFGANADPEVAAYAFTVLRRQLASDKSKHLARVRKRANRERRGEEFAAGWIHAIRAMFPQADLPAGREDAIRHAITLRLGKTEKTEGKEVGKSGKASASDRLAGWIAGKGAEVHAGVTSQQKSLEHL
ncbi:MAG: DUF2786 domain-containing protein [Pseudoxanthomonas sp.]|uniref:DUF2786 domain-containing protein n=1 Tax=Pseudoxanthomonas sp. TaxID=1871049 RepID=UPI00258C3833|nr:DUF2786 domain-containing protein [Pseudoxanthomonas sp.]MCH2092683.1 DUF2786 domain-containing protein [Pseudoxanthomonas sp.]